jgi:hypothetical protein
MEQGGKEDDSNDSTSNNMPRFLGTPTLVRLEEHVPLSLPLRREEYLNERHQRLAHHINNEEISWNEILQSMDAYKQRLTVSKTNKEPCEEYKLLEKYGMKYLSQYKSIQLRSGGKSSKITKTFYGTDGR